MVTPDAVSVKNIPACVLGNTTQVPTHKIAFCEILTDSAIFESFDKAEHSTHRLQIFENVF